LLEFWRSSDRWNEWTADRSAAAGRGTRHLELKSIRQEVLLGLRHCSTGSWILYSRFYKMLVRSSKGFRRLAEHPVKGRTLSAGGTTTDELVRRMLRGPLMWVGLVDLGNAEAFAQPLHQETKAAFRVTPTGRALLEGEPPDPETLPRTHPEARLIIQPTLEVLAPPDLPYAHLITLCGMAQLKSIDVVSHFQVTREAFQRAMNRGMTGEAIRGFLLSASATGLPDMVDSLIRDCERKHGEIEIGTSSGYLTVAREEILDELLAQKQIAPSIELRVSPTSAILRRGTSLESLVQTLSRQGYMPRMLQDTAEAEDESHHIPMGSSELSELVAFLETAMEELRGNEPTAFAEVGGLLRRLRVALRRVPDRHRQSALTRFRRAIETQRRDTDTDRARQDLLKYDGENPTTRPPEVRTMMGYAIDRRLCVEIGYGPESEDGPDGRLVEPFSEDHAMLYAYCRSRRGDRVFRLDRIRFARLTSERAQRR
ncbi:MAG: helicase-associated domain-containing protein, partial [Candidatus Latescibacteria bacterium]|nr:helicase-associated domain-containing protein [Candidatus Latescibacterota bacterium]